MHHQETGFPFQFWGPHIELNIHWFLLWSVEQDDSHVYGLLIWIQHIIGLFHCSFLSCTCSKPRLGVAWLAHMSNGHSGLHLGVCNNSFQQNPNTSWPNFLEFFLSNSLDCHCALNKCFENGESSSLIWSRNSRTVPVILFNSINFFKVSLPFTSVVFVPNCHRSM